MAQDTFACPECSSQLRRAPNLESGALIQCPRCDHRFTVPPESDSDGFTTSPEPARPPVEDRPDPDREGTRRAEDPPASPLPPLTRSSDYDDDDYGVRRPRPAIADEDYVNAPRGMAEDLSGDYEVTIGRWLALAWEHYGAYAGPAIGYLFLCQLIDAAASMVSSLINVLIDPALQAGPMVVALAQLKGRSWKFSTFFHGFKIFGQALGLAWLQGVAIAGAMLPGIIAAIVSVFLDANGNFGQPFSSALGIGLAVACLVAGVAAGTYVGVRLTTFALPLVIDRNFGVTEALRGSWRLTAGGRVFGLILFQVILFGITVGPMLVVVGGLITLMVAMKDEFGPDAVMLAFIGGSLFAALPTIITIPFVKLAQAAAYLDVAGTSPPLSRLQAEDRQAADEF